jgi:hypothetical protein
MDYDLPKRVPDWHTSATTLGVLDITIMGLPEYVSGSKMTLYRHGALRILRTPFPVDELDRIFKNELFLSPEEYLEQYNMLES